MTQLKIFQYWIQVLFYLKLTTMSHHNSWSKQWFKEFNIFPKFAIVDCSLHNTAHVNVSHNAFFFDIDIMVKKEIEWGLALSVLLST